MLRQNYRVVVVMPCFKEADGIAEFLREIARSFTDYDTTILVIDDHSPDSTADVVEQLAKELGSVIVLRQQINRGHGPSTLVALNAGLALEPEVIVATDGDGQISGKDLRRLCDSVLLEKFGYGEGIRMSRDDPWFRRLVSAATRGLLFARTGKMVRDANTPFRAYRPDQLRKLLGQLSPGSAIPNLVISAVVRRWSWEVQQVEVESLLRRGNSEEGSSWNQKNPFLPSSNFLRFCIRAIKEWLTFKVDKKY